jgi:hypothetical protein
LPELQDPKSESVQIIRRYTCCSADHAIFKCDEARPQCEKCIAYGLLCNYDPNASELQMSVQRLVKGNLEESNQVAIRKEIEWPSIPRCFAIVCSDANTSFELDGQSLERLLRFRTGTVYTLASPTMIKLYQDDILKLAHFVR